MIKSISKTVCLSALLCLLPTSVQAQVNGLFSNPRIFNDYPGSALTITNSNSNPGNVTIDDRAMTNPTGTGANRHDVLLSTDAGATAATFPTSQAVRITASLTLTNGSTTPRKEAGLRFNSGVTGDCLFIVNSDAGEIVAFGGPFYNFRDAGGFNEPAYVPGQTILMGIEYRPGSPGTIEYFIDRGAGIKSSGQLPFTNLEGGPVNFQAGVYAQGGSGNNTADFFNANFANVSAALPEPATLGMATLGGLAMLMRRRRA